MSLQSMDDVTIFGAIHQGSTASSAATGIPEPKDLTYYLHVY